MNLKLGRLLFLCLLFACATPGKKDGQELRELYLQKDFKAGLKKIKKSEIKKDPKTQLLYHFYQSQFYYLNKKYLVATKELAAAQGLIDEYFTKSIKDKLSKSFSNNYAEKYWGMPFERGMIYYYQAMSFLQLAQNKNKSDSEQSQYLYRARASILAWDSFMQDYSRTYQGQTLYEFDLLLKILGANVHESVGTRNDLQIARQLYLDAKNILLKHGNLFKNYNSQFKEYTQKAQENLTNKKKENLNKFVTVTSHQKNLLAYLESKLQKKNNNVAIVLEYGLINPVEVKEFDYSLGAAAQNSDSGILKGIGIPIITYFALGPLGLGAVSRTGDSYLFVRHGAGEALIESVGIQFELPIIKEDSLSPELELFVQTKGSQEVLFKRTLALASPLSDLALLQMQERVAEEYVTIGTRVAIKHLSAIVAAYLTYKSFAGNSENDFFARLMAIGQYLASANAIKASEKADVRFWSTLPKSVYMDEFQLPIGTYELYIEKNGKKRKIGELDIKDQKKALFTHQYL
jgi:hypothetical protein